MVMIVMMGMVIVGLRVFNEYKFAPQKFFGSSLRFGFRDSNIHIYSWFSKYSQAITAHSSNQNIGGLLFKHDFWKYSRVVLRCRE